LGKNKEGDIQLEKGSEAALAPVSEAGTVKDKKELARLSEIIDILNDRFGTDFTEADKYRRRAREGRNSVATGKKQHHQ
jgi:type I restriction enzyme R subunit